MPRNNQQLKTDLADAAERIIRLSDTTVIAAWMEEFPDLPIPSATKEDLQEEKASIVTDYYKESTAVTGASLFPAVESAKEGFKSALAVASGGGLSTAVIQLLLASDAWWSAVGFAVGYPIGPIVADTLAMITLPVRPALLPAIMALMIPIPLTGDDFEDFVQSARLHAEREALIYIEYAMNIKTTHVGPDVVGAPQTVPEQPTT